MGMHIGILTGGGDCPGLNAVIRAVTLALVNEARPRSPASSAASWAC
jgi:6-phosphofructokinase